MYIGSYLYFGYLALVMGLGMGFRSIGSIPCGFISGLGKMAPKSLLPVVLISITSVQAVFSLANLIGNSWSQQTLPRHYIALSPHHSHCLVLRIKKC
jgi:hypothetical protein